MAYLPDYEPDYVLSVLFLLSRERLSLRLAWPARPVPPPQQRPPQSAYRAPYSAVDEEGAVYVGRGTNGK